MDIKYVIDKDYTFYAYGGGDYDEVSLHVQLNNEEALKYGQYFSEKELEDNEIDIEFNIKDQLDDELALVFAEVLFEQWKEYHEGNEVRNEEEEDDEDLTIEDFYDAGWQMLSETYYYYCWSPDFIIDCKEYYQKNLEK